MALDALSTQQEIRDEYVASAGYREENSVALAARFIKAVRIILLNPKRYKTPGHEAEFDPSQLRMQLDEAVEWHEANKPVTSGQTGMFYGSFENFR